MILKIEIEFSDNSRETCNIVKKYSNGDYNLSRKNRRRMELISAWDEEYLIHKFRDKYVWISVYLKDTKGHEEARVRRIE